MKSCMPIWSEIEKQFKDKIENITIGYRGILIDEFDFRDK